MTITRRTLMGSLPVLAASSRVARAQAWPQRPLTLVVGFTPGGAGDVMARVVASQYSEMLGQTVVVENRPGASGTIAAAAVARSPADGYTLFLNTAPDTAIWPLVKPVSYSIERDFTLISLLCTVPSVLVVPAESPIQSVEGLVSYARAHPGKLNYGSFGYGSSAHMAAELFQNATTTKLTYTPYQGSARAVIDLLAGRIDLIFDTFASAWSHIQAGKLRALAVTTATRVPVAPQISTMQEVGVPDYVSQSFIGISAPAGIPTNVKDRLEAGFSEIVKSSRFRDRLNDLGMIPAGLNSSDFKTFIESEIARNRKLIADSKLVFE